MHTCSFLKDINFTIFKLCSERMALKHLLVMPLVDDSGVVLAGLDVVAVELAE